MRSCSRGETSRRRSCCSYRGSSPPPSSSLSASSCRSPRVAQSIGFSSGSAVDTLQFAPFQGLVQEFFRFVPRFLVALLVFTLGFLIGNFLWRATTLAAVNAGLPGARLLGSAVRLLVIAIGVVMALEQLGLATAVVLTAFAIMFGALMLGAAIAFGLGGRDAAKQLLERKFKTDKHRDSDAAPHL